MKDKTQAEREKELKKSKIEMITISTRNIKSIQHAHDLSLLWQTQIQNAGYDVQR